MKRRTLAQLVGTISLIAVAVAYLLVSRFAKPWDDVVGIGSIPVVLLAIFLLFMGTTRIVDPSWHYEHTIHKSSLQTIDGQQRLVRRAAGTRRVQATRGLVIFYTALGAVLYAVAIFMLVRGGANAVQKVIDDAERARVRAQEREAANAARPENRIMASSTIADALSIAAPTDSKDDVSAGAKLMHGWAMQKLTWAMVDVPVNETSIAQIQQSPDQVRGKRLCATGTIVEAGRLRVTEHEQITYLAVGPRAPTVGQTVRFCGTSLGRHDVTFTSEGPKRTALVLGMFEAGTTAEHAP